MYEKVQLKRHVIDDVNKFVHPYFTHLKNGNVAANNGWIMNADPRENFTTSNN